MDAAFYSTAEEIRNALSQIGAACELHEAELQKLQTEYQRLGQQAGAAFSAGRDEEYNAITQQQAAIKGEIVVREKELQTLREQSNAPVSYTHLDVYKRQVVNSIDLNQDYLPQTGTSNVNIFVPDKVVTIGGKMCIRDS